MSASHSSARLHALAAALCALLLLVALGIMDAYHGPWWALLATQGALLVTTASAGMWLDRATGAGREARGARGPQGRDVPDLSDADVFWEDRILRGNREE